MYITLHPNKFQIIKQTSNIHDETKLKFKNNNRGNLIYLTDDTMTKYLANTRYLDRLSRSQISSYY